MSNAYIIQKSTLDGIGDAIREKTGGTDLIPLVDMGDAIRGIQSGGSDDVASAIVSRTITEYADNNITSVGSYAFDGCSKLTTVNCPSVTRVGNYAFDGCSSLTSIDVPQVTSVGNYAFDGCSSLTSIDVPQVTSVGSYVFRGCSSLTSIDVPQVTSIDTYTFAACSKLTTIDLPQVTSIGTYALQNCYSLTSIILRKDSIVTLYGTNAFGGCSHLLGTRHSTYNPDALKDGHIYVPSALVESYKTASKWSDFATQFRALEDYTVDGTITGELDMTKI